MFVDHKKKKESESKSANIYISFFDTIYGGIRSTDTFKSIVMVECDISKADTRFVLFKLV